MPFDGRTTRITYTNAQTIQLQKGMDGETGMIIREPASGPCVVAKIAPSSPAAFSGIQIGDQLLSVNGNDVSTASLTDVVYAFRSAPSLMFLVVTRPNPASQSMPPPAPLAQSIYPPLLDPET